MLLIHGSSVVINDQCIIFTGDCGAGKSTICAALRKAGFEFLADDISMISFNKDGHPVVQPAFPQLRLCDDAVQNIDYDKEKISSVCKHDNKSIFNNTGSFKNEAVPLGAIVELSPKQDCETVTINKVTGREKVSSFIRNIYCSGLIGKIDFNVELSKQSFNVIKRISYLKIERPVGKFTVNEQVKLVVESLSI
jgi:hypothetical protein